MFMSIVVPCYKSVNTLEQVIREIKKTMQIRQVEDYEIILVNDCSPDHTMELIQNLCFNDKKIKGIELSKNFGQASALMAGFSYATGDYIVTAEDDGQSSINKVWEMYDELEKGYDIVCAKNITNPPRSPIRKLGAKLNRFMLNYLLEKPKDISPSIFFIAKKQVIHEMLQYNNPYPYIGGLILRSTSKIGNIDINRRDRISGKSGYNLKKLSGLYLNGVTSFSVKPLRLASAVGMLFFLIGFITVMAISIRKIFLGGILPGYTSLLSVLLIIGGIILCVLGIIGEYVGRIYMCINGTPQFIIRNKINFED